MRSALILTVFTSFMVFSPLAGADPLPTIDWRQFDEILEDTGDHVVGEEPCARPS
ncbi:MAG: hypothetical protein IH994_08130 [Proteobacteria bacterium]|nr:hypothetical protein [Pseudomonadota bacterium]